MKSKRLVLVSLVSVGLGATSVAGVASAWVVAAAPAAVEDPIVQRVVMILVEHLDAKIEDIVPHASLVEDLGADSLDMVELVMELEKAFEIDITDPDCERLDTVNDVINLVRSK